MWRRKRYSQSTVVFCDMSRLTTTGLCRVFQLPMRVLTAACNVWELNFSPKSSCSRREYIVDHLSSFRPSEPLRLAEALVAQSLA